MPTMEQQPQNWMQATANTPPAAGNAAPGSAPNWMTTTQTPNQGMGGAAGKPAWQSSFGDSGQIQLAAGQNPERYRQDSIDAYYQQGASRLDPRENQRQEALETQLANMGHTRGSEGWNREMERSMQQRNDAYGSLNREATMQGAQDATRMQGMDLASGAFANQAQNQQYTQGLGRADLANRAMAGSEQARIGELSSNNSLNASLAGTAANERLGNRGLDQRQQQQDFDMSWEAQMNPLRYQNLAMGGMSPGGQPNQGAFHPAGSPNMPSQLPYNQSAYGARMNQGNDWGALGGSLLNNAGNIWNAGKDIWGAIS